MVVATNPKQIHVVPFEEEGNLEHEHISMSFGLYNIVSPACIFGLKSSSPMYFKQSDQELAKEHPFLHTSIAFLVSVSVIAEIIIDCL